MRLFLGHEEGTRSCVNEMLIKRKFARSVSGKLLEHCSTMFADRILLRILFNDLIMYHWYFMFMAFTAKCGTSNTLALFKVCFLCLLIHLYQRRFVYLPLVVAQTL